MRQDDHALENLRSAVAHADARAPAVSPWSVGTHVGHCCLATISICKALSASTPPPPRSRLPWRTACMLWTGRIPRGRAQAPRAVVPEREMSPEDLCSLLEETARRLAEAAALDRRTWFRHFALGVLDRDRALRFVRIHHRHHLKVIADIVAR